MRALSVLGRAIPPESTAVIASVGEPAAEVIDGEMAKLAAPVRPVERQGEIRTPARVTPTRGS